MLTTEQKLKNAPKKHLRRKIVTYSLICVFVHLGVFVPFSAFSAFSVCKIFS